MKYESNKQSNAANFYSFAVLSAGLTSGVWSDETLMDAECSDITERGVRSGATQPASQSLQ